MGNLEKLLVVGVLVVVIAILGISLFWTSDVATLPEVSNEPVAEGSAEVPVGDLGVGMQPLSAVSPNPASSAAPVGMTPNLMEPAVAAPTAGEENYISYTIKSGDTLDKIAKAHKISISEITKANEGLDPKKLRIGRSILLPKDAGAAILTGSPADTSVPSAKELTKDPVKKEAKADELVPTGRVTTYTVEKGDTFWKISKRVYGDGAKWKKILDANKKVCPTENSLRPGMNLSIP